MKNGSYRARLACYERLKKEIYATSKTQEEVQRRLTALIKKLKL